MFCRCYSSFIDPVATSCANHYSAGRTSNGEYYIKVSGVTFKVSVSSAVLVLFITFDPIGNPSQYWGFNSCTFTP